MELSTDHIVKHVLFRPVRPSDAEFILSLRLDEERGKYLSAVTTDVEAQRNWIIAYMKREEQGTEYYFIIVDPVAGDVGTIRLYDFQGDSFSWGSWVLKPGAPWYGGLESALLVYEIGFKQLGFQRCHIETMRENTKIAAFQTRLGARPTGEDDQKRYFTLEKSMYETTREKYRRLFAST